jgi:hypothetical protein
MSSKDKKRPRHGRADRPHPPAWKRAVVRVVRATPLGRSDAPRSGARRSRYDQLQPPPVAPPDWQSGPPDFVIIGAQKSGTTWWQGLLEGHLEIHRPHRQRRELHFFDHFWDRWPTPEQLELYQRYFPRPQGSLVGEKTPGYLYQPWVAPMLKRVAPETRLIVLMRDPVERYISNLGLLKRAGALKGEVGAGTLGTREYRVVEAMERSRYATQLAWWLEHFPRQQFLLLQYEQCVAETQTQLDRTYAFLGLRSQNASVSEIARTRKKSREHVTLSADVRAWLADYYADDVDRLRSLMPDLDLSLWQSLPQDG